MKCEDVEVELSGGTVPEAVRAHLETCASCSESAKVLGLAALPAVSESEKLLLSSLAATTQKAWRDRQSRTSSVRRVASLALAAGLGALLASGVMLKVMPTPEAKIVTRTEIVAVPELAAFDKAPWGDGVGWGSSDFNLSDDEVFFEVGWPSPTDDQGDL